MTPPPVQSPASRIARGSRWRKWDLHIHSPLSAVNDYPQLPDHQGPDWEKYLNAIESLSDISVIGLTDYFSIEGYRKLRDFKNAGRLANIDRILPNIELRLDKILASKKDGKEPRRLNLHVLFSDELDPDLIDEHFLGELRFVYDASPDDPDSRRRLSRSSLEELGRKLKDEHRPFRSGDRSDFALGCGCAAVSPNDVSEALQKPEFRGKHLVVFAEQYSELIDWDGQDHLARKVIVSGSHAIFSSSERTRRWALGKEGVNDFIKEFKTLKPCIHGSDAHSLEKIGKPDGDRFCWIKADTTFEGLRQIIFESEERTYVGPSPVILKPRHRIIGNVQIRESPCWFGDLDVPLSEDLVCVIGGRGTGKSALAELIAYAAGAFQADDNGDSFLQRAVRRSDTNLKPVVGTKVQLDWCGGDKTAAEIDSKLTRRLDQPQVKYLPQKFVERLCDPRNNQEIEAEIENVIYQRLDPEDRLGTSNFSELRKAKTKPLQVRRRSLQAAIRGLNEAIFRDQQQISTKTQKTSDLHKAQSDLELLLKGQPLMPEAKPEDLTELEALESTKSELTRRLTRINEKLNIVEQLRAVTQTFSSEMASYNSRIVSLLAELEMEVEVDAFIASIPSETNASIERLIAVLRAQAMQLREGAEDDAKIVNLKTINGKIATVRERLKLTQEARQVVENFNQERQLLQSTVTALKNEIDHIDNVLDPGLKKYEESRLNSYLDLWDLLTKEREALGGLYKPLGEALATGSETGKKLEFFSKISFDSGTHTERAVELIDSRRKGKLKHRDDIEAALKSFFENVYEGEFNREIISEAVGSLRQEFDADADGSPAPLSGRLSSKRTTREFDDWFYSIEAFGVGYSLKFDGKELSLLSPGQKGIVLVLVYLEIDLNDTRPLIIDQPDDNLDSQSVYDHLIEYFRRRKKSRQIIMVTHNPNLVVNTDAEQILVASYSGDVEPRICYRGGALEDVGSPGYIGIRQLACDVLEGGTDAFRKREEKYALKVDSRPRPARSEELLEDTGVQE